KIPHEEIIERQNTIKYVRAARMAHEGASLAEIAQEVALPMGEIEFIAKVNKDRLMFDEGSLPEWARVEEPATEEETRHDEGILKDSAEDFEFRTKDLSGVFDVPKEEYSSLQKLGDEFREACRTFETRQAEESEESVEASKLMDAARKVTDRLMSKASAFLHDSKKDSEVDFIETPTSSVEEVGESESIVRAHVPSEISESFVLDLDRKREEQNEDEGPEIIMPGQTSFKTTMGKAEPVGEAPSFELNQNSLQGDERQTRFEILDQTSVDQPTANGLRPREVGVRKVAFPKINVNDYLG
ncbi:MAG: DUF2802 domain-containing protein, partial [Bdellovibrionales bacterium]|nr:DUF2802 domain-containing protein [Bdellovibrionales bacterium]